MVTPSQFYDDPDDMYAQKRKRRRTTSPLQTATASKETQPPSHFVRFFDNGYEKTHEQYSTFFRVPLRDTAGGALFGVQENKPDPAEDQDDLVGGLCDSSWTPPPPGGLLQHLYMQQSRRDVAALSDGSQVMPQMRSGGAPVPLQEGSARMPGLQVAPSVTLAYLPTRAGQLAFDYQPVRAGEEEWGCTFGFGQEYRAGAA